MDAQETPDANPFDVFDREAARLDAHFAGLDGDAWDRPSRCSGWSVRDVLAHLAGEELYNHACLDDDLGGLFARLEKEGVDDLDAFNDWCVRTRRDRPIGEVLAEWRGANADTRRRMRERGADAMLSTMSGPYPVGLQTWHYASEYATHADDVAAPVDPAERDARTAWRAEFGRSALGEADTPVRVERVPGGYRVTLEGRSAELPAAEFVEATTGRLPDDHPLDRELRSALVCLA
ncbi:maleylpyruvate isomerase family mycothiol-dependent enzyme [Actinomadura kijaniata]|uniref:maleylpyruvate isomerase family mycothiol-dependent enzyme n=1 Tax=Actinomadura kijaniata TaxID=46161 RepID=UPI0008345110|nr:maleylpyruvate isomerase family mycothiol-dependent enzyme [Actinomadura kijaniata]